MTARVAVDIGGTFTDVVAYDSDSGQIVVGKTLSTPDDLLRGISSGLSAADIEIENVAQLVHGSTLVINALLERKGSRAALVTTAGFRDIYEIGRVNRPDAFNLDFTRHRPLIPRELVFEVDERMLATGEVLHELDEAAVRTLAGELADRGVEAVAVMLLHSYRNPAHEVRVGEILRSELPGVYVTLSHELTREYREFERTSTVAANAFVGPIVDAYLGRLKDLFGETSESRSVVIMQSNGGLADIDRVRRECVQMVESGPAGGVVGTIEACQALGFRDAIAFDMGGTTAKASVIRDLTFPQATEYFFGGYVTGMPLRVPCLDIVEVGTGGGSVAWVDTAGGLHVGPRSAGAAPGPACYGMGGTSATVTDAAVVLGVLAADGALAGGLKLDAEAARSAVSRVGGEVGLSLVDAASGILSIAASSMANAVRAVTTERGLDPRDFALFAFGGNGPLHISLVARELGVTTVVIPPDPSVFSAVGMLQADVRHDVVQTEIHRLDSIDATALEAKFRKLEREGGDKIQEGGLAHEGLSYLWAADMRYVGQEHFLTVSIPAPGDDWHTRLQAAFDTAHQERFGHSAPGEPAELVSLRVSAVGRMPRIVHPALEQGTETPEADTLIGSRLVTFEPGSAARECAVYRRDRLRANNRIVGPAAIEEPTTTTLVRPGDVVDVHERGYLMLTIGESA